MCVCVFDCVCGVVSALCVCVFDCVWVCVRARGGGGANVHVWMLLYAGDSLFVCARMRV